MILYDEYDIVKFVEVLKKLDFEKPHEATVEPYDPTNTLQQKKLYWKWIGIIIKDTGEYKYEQDRKLREEILIPIPYINARGLEKEYYKRISELGKKEMSEYMTQVSIMTSEFGINLPHPSDQQRN